MSLNIMSSSNAIVKILCRTVALRQAGLYIMRRKYTGFVKH